MELKEFFYVVGAFIVIMLIFKFADKWIKSLPPATAKTINWIGLGIAAAGGLAWYAFGSGVYMIITVAGVVIYFLFYHYDDGGKTEGKGVL
ncbi:MAG: hypothetical protein HY894_05885 [Deltaproteobacteria bacterium]|nr:hypothetical protein [Deltaproteobacteria bacterium]